MSNVVAFKDTVPDGEPYGELVSTIEDLLERARSGNLRALGYVTIATNNVIGTGWDGADGTRHPLAAGIIILQSRYAEGLQRAD